MRLNRHYLAQGGGMLPAGARTDLIAQGRCPSMDAPLRWATRWNGTRQGGQRGKLLGLPQQFTYVMLNKPGGW